MRITKDGSRLRCVADGAPVSYKWTDNIRVGVSYGDTYRPTEGQHYNVTCTAFIATNCDTKYPACKRGVAAKGWLAEFDVILAQTRCVDHGVGMVLAPHENMQEGSECVLIPPPKYHILSFKAVVR